MDIVITLPKMLQEEPDYGLVEINKVVFRAWQVAWKPKNLLVGDRVYFVDNGFIDHYYVFASYATDPYCEFKQSILRGQYMLLRTPAKHLDTLIPMESFPRYRYIMDQFE